jgi:hypothetical protein
MNIRIPKRSLALVILAGSFASRAARAGESPPEPPSKPQPEAFGEAGQIVVSGATQANVSHASYSTPSGETSQPSNTSFVIAPTGDIFVVRGFSLGARLTYVHEHSTGLPDLNGISIGPRIGYNFTSDCAAALPSCPPLLSRFRSHGAGQSEVDGIGA